MRDLSQINTELGNRFSQHLFALNSDITPAESLTIWLDIATHYNETGRAYHSLRHTQQLFFNLNTFASTFTSLMSSRWHSIIMM